MDIITTFVFYVAAMYITAVKGYPLDRQQSFLTPTTYPVPTYQQNTNPIPTIPHILTARPILGNTQPMSVLNNIPSISSINCPTKRDVSIRRVVLDDAMLRDMYNEQIGKIDTRYLTETMEDDINSNFTDEIDKEMEGNETTALLRDELINDIVKKDFETFSKWVSTVFANVTNSSNEITSYPSEHSWLTDFLEEHNMTEEQLKYVLELKTDITTLKNVYVKRNRTRRTVGVFGSKCYDRGSQTDDGFLHMCKTCSETRMFSENVFPRIATEYACDPNDCKCMIFGGIAHGKCQNVTLNIKMLRRKPGGCQLLIHDGTREIADSWEVYDQPLHVGCECVMNKISPYAVGVIGKR